MIEFEKGVSSMSEEDIDIRFQGGYMIINITNIKVSRKAGRELLQKLLEAQENKEI